MPSSDYFLDIAEIKGEAPTDGKFKDQIEVMSFSFGVTQLGAHSSGAGGGAGKASFQDIHFTMQANKASPLLMVACCNGTHIPKAVLTVRKAGGKQEDYYKVTLEDLLVSSYQVGGGGGDAPVPTDSFSLNYTKIEFSYAPQKKGGQLDTAIVRKYDIKAQKS